MSVGPGTPDASLPATSAQLGPVEAADFIAFESQRTDVAEVELIQIADTLGRQPEALVLAARLLAERPGASAAVYLEAIAEHAAAAPGTPAYPKTYRAAVLTSFEIVEHGPAMQGRAPTSILALAAFLPEGVLSASLLDGEPDRYPPELQPFIADSRLRHEALALLDRLGLIQLDSAGGSFVVPELTKAVVRDLLAEAGEPAIWQAAAELVVRTAAADRPIPEVPLAPPPAPMPSRDDAVAHFEAAEELTASGRTEEALARHEVACTMFSRLAEVAPGDVQAQADLAASHAKIGLTYASAGRVREGLEWLTSCLHLITELQRREPSNDLWPRYLASLQSEIAGLSEKSGAPEAIEVVPEPPAPSNGTSAAHRLVSALKASEDEPVLLTDRDTSGTDEEPMPLELDGERGPPKVFTSESLFAEEAGLVPPAPPPARRSRFLTRLFGRRD
jgi:tetratricopeptide (TPR) repeat protein